MRSELIEQCKRDQGHGESAHRDDSNAELQLIFHFREVFTEHGKSPRVDPGSETYGAAKLVKNGLDRLVRPRQLRGSCT